jgi:hypothetical protein
MPNPTPGQVAFAAYVAKRHDFEDLGASYIHHLYMRYQTLLPEEQAAWEAAAQAAITAWWQAHEAIICGEEDAADA